MTSIRSFAAQEILDSRGKPTIAVTVVLKDSATGSAASREAVELRDGISAAMAARVWQTSRDRWPKWPSDVTRRLNRDSTRR